MLTLPAACPSMMHQYRYVADTCWAYGCRRYVPSDDDHIGLCPDHLEELRCLT